VKCKGCKKCSRNKCLSNVFSLLQLRRERISERIKALQELVPSCNKVCSILLLPQIPLMSILSFVATYKNSCSLILKLYIQKNGNINFCADPSLYHDVKVPVLKIQKKKVIITSCCGWVLLIGFKLLKMKNSCNFQTSNS